MADNSLIRFIAGAQRKLDKDMELSELEAIDRVQKLYKRFKDDWIGSPWLVLPDRYCLPATMPVPEMLEEIAKHGQPVGIVGMALLPKSKTYRVLEVHFKKDKKSRDAVEFSVKTAEEKFVAASRKVEGLFNVQN